VAPKQTENSLNLGRVNLAHLGPVWFSIHLTVPLGILFVCYDFNVTAQNTVAFFLVFLLAVGIHEGAHLIIEQIFGQTNRRNSTDGFFAASKASDQPPSTHHAQREDFPSSGPPATASLTVTGIWWSKPWNSRWTYLAGPIANLLAAGYILASYAGGGITPREWDSLLMPQTLTGQLFLTNAWLGILNFISAPPADLGFALSHYYRPINKEGAQLSSSHIRSAQWILFPVLALALLAGKLGIAIGTGYILFTTFRASVWNACIYNGYDSKIAKYVTQSESLRLFRRADSIDSTLEVLMTAHQDYFPIVEGPVGEQTAGSISAFGVVERNTILSAIAQGEGNSPISSLIDDTIRTVSPDDTITSLFYEFHPDEEAVCIVQQNNNFIGLIFPNKISHVVWIKSIKELVEL
jgi:predicted transcriptional regulator